MIVVWSEVPWPVIEWQFNEFMLWGLQHCEAQGSEQFGKADTNSTALEPSASGLFLLRGQSISNHRQQVGHLFGFPVLLWPSPWSALRSGTAGTADKQHAAGDCRECVCVCNLMPSRDLICNATETHVSVTVTLRVMLRSCLACSASSEKHGKARLPLGWENSALPLRKAFLYIRFKF
eukprot:6490641-Amphidinium_carterae.3